MPNSEIGHIWLTGFSGSGKSTVAPRLAKRMGRRWCDVDTMIEAHFSLAIPAVFSTHGEREFRAVESRTVADLARRKSPLVIALGGGVLERRANHRVIRRSGTLVYLRCAQRELYRRLRRLGDRPLLHDRGGEATPARILRDRIARLMRERRATYEQAEIIVSTTNRRPDDIAAKVLERLNRLYA